MAEEETIVKAGGKRPYVLPKRRLTFNGLHGVISQKIVIFLSTAVITSNPSFGLFRNFYLKEWM
jgi:hypothetical protein